MLDNQAANLSLTHRAEKAEAELEIAISAITRTVHDFEAIDTLIHLISAHTISIEVRAELALLLAFADRSKNTLSTWDIPF